MSQKGAKKKKDVVETKSSSVIICTKCDQAFFDKEALAAHNPECSRKSQTYTCSECGLVFTYKIDYYHHVKIAHPNNSTSDSSQYLTCPLCHKIFKDFHCMRAHIAWMHTGNAFKGITPPSVEHITSSDSTETKTHTNTNLIPNIALGHDTSISYNKNELTTRLETLVQDQMVKHQEQYNHLLQKCQRLENDASSILDQKRSLEEQYTILLAKHQDLETQYQDTSSHLNDLKKEHASQLKTCKNLETQQAKLKVTNQKINKELKLLQDKQKRLEKDHATLQEQYILLEQEHEHQQEVIEDKRQQEVIEDKRQQEVIEDKRQQEVIEDERTTLPEHDSQQDITFQVRLVDLLLGDFEKWVTLTLQELGKYIGHKLKREYQVSVDKEGQSIIFIHDKQIHPEDLTKIIHDGFYPLFFDPKLGDLLQQLLFMWIDSKEQLDDSDIASTIETFLDIIENKDPDLCIPILQGMIDVYQQR
jgi:uncharacterized C2H2 Zn-finger protein